MTLPDLNSRIEAIEKRNAQVELNKAWETSFTRKIILMIFTYLSVGLYMSAINIDRPWLNAIIPSLGFLLSTLTLPLFKSLWQRYMHR